MTINFHSSLKMAYCIHPPPSLCWNLVRSAQKGPSDSAFSVGMWLNRIEVFPLLTFLFSLSSHYRFWYKVLYIVVIRILACFCLRFAEIRVNISSFELTLKLTLSFSFFLFSWNTCWRSTYILMLSKIQTISKSKFRTAGSFLRVKLERFQQTIILCLKEPWLPNYHNPISRYNYCSCFL